MKAGSRKRYGQAFTGAGDDAEFKAALKDLKDAIRDGMAKLNGRVVPVRAGFDQAEIDALMNGP